jgi:acetyltransferase
MRSRIDGIQTVARLKDLGWAPDLVLIATPAAVVPRIAAEAADCGAGAVAVLTAAMGQGRGSPMAQLHAMARERGLRILGPNCLGVINPHMQLNASLARHSPQAGDIALICSPARSAPLVEWAGPLDRFFVGGLARRCAGRGFRRPAGLLRHRPQDPRHPALRRSHPRRAQVHVAARGRAHQAGGGDEGAPAGYVLSDNGHEPQIGDDAVYDAAFRRAGLLRVHSLDELFAAAETLGRLHAVPGAGWACSPTAVASARCRPTSWSRSAVRWRTCPVPPSRGWIRACRWAGRAPIGGSLTDIDAERYADTLGAAGRCRQRCVAGGQRATVLSSSVESAQALIDAGRRGRRRKPVLAVWLGNDPAATGLLNAAGIPNYPNESDAVDGFSIWSATTRRRWH